MKNQLSACVSRPSGVSELWEAGFGDLGVWRILSNRNGEKAVGIARRSAPKAKKEGILLPPSSPGLRRQQVLFSKCPGSSAGFAARETMRQVGILPSGCQIYRRVSVLHYDTEKIVYASSLAVYVLDAHTYSIRHILSLNQRAITSIVVSPLDPDLLIVTGRDGTVTLWNIPNEEILSQLLINGSVIAAWNPLMKNNAAILSEDSVRLHNWDTDRGSAAVQETFNVRSDALKPCVFRQVRKRIRSSKYCFL